MPATAPQQNSQPVPTDQWMTHTDDHLTGMQQKVTDNLKEAGTPVPFEAVKPIHVPDGTPVNIVDEAKIATEKSVPSSFDSTPATALSPLKALSEHLDYADQIVTGRTHVLGEANSFSREKVNKEQKRMEHANAPKVDSRGPVKKLVDWLHE